ncbi:hypothetical protein A7X85_05435 [Streptomyces sp. ST1015]|nr:hypothetical protein A7X85_05435 [Streptomyces sp. ST1015]
MPPPEDYHPVLGHYRVPSEKTLRSVLGRLDPADLNAAQFAYLASLLPTERAHPAPPMPDGGPEREQSRAHQAAAQAGPARPRRRTIEVDGKCLLGARPPDGSRVLRRPVSLPAHARSRCAVGTPAPRV